MPALECRNHCQHYLVKGANTVRQLIGLIHSPSEGLSHCVTHILVSTLEILIQDHTPLSSKS